MQRREEPEESADGRRDANAEILAAAAQAFMKHGLAATSIDAVAGILGSTKGRIYYHYRSKADLFFAIHRAAMKLNLATIAPIAAGAGEPVEKLEAMIRAHVRLITDHLPLQRVFVQGVEMHVSGSTTPEQRRTLRAIVDMRDKYEKHFVDVLSEGMEADQFAGFDPRLVVKPLLGSLNWITFWYRERPEDTEDSRRHLAEQISRYLMYGLVKARPPEHRR